VYKRQLDKIREAHQPPPAPTYTEHLAGGATQDVEITDEMAATWAKDDPDTWAEHSEKWAEYTAIVDELTEALNDRIWEAVMRRAMKFEMPDDNAWAEEQGLFGLEIPDEPLELRVHYIRTEVIGSIADILKLTALANGSDLSEEALSLAESSFRDSLVRDLLRGLTSQVGSVADRDEGGTDADREGVGPET